LAAPWVGVLTAELLVDDSAESTYREIRERYRLPIVAISGTLSLERVIIDLICKGIESASTHIKRTIRQTYLIFIGSENTNGAQGVQFGHN